MCTTRRRSFASFEAKLGNSSSTCFAMKQTIRCRHMSSHHLHPIISFEAQTDKPPPTWLWGTNQETVAVILKPKSSNHRPWFWCPNQETVIVILRLNYRQTVAINFEAKPENPRFSSPPRVWCRSHMVSPDLPIVWSLSTRLVPDHPWSSASSLLLLPRSLSLFTMSHSPPTHHEISKHVSPHRIPQYMTYAPN
jgi:hypothetical protein